MMCPRCKGAGVVDTSPPGVERAPWMQTDTDCPDCNGTGLRLESGIYGAVREERRRAYAKHGDTSMEAQPVDAWLRLSILMEEVGEVAREFNEGRHRGTGPDLGLLRKELIQTAAMAVAWADAIGAPK